MTTTLNYSFTATMNKKEARNLRSILNPLTRPAHISPKKKVSWRLVKKWFNRYEKPEWLKRSFVVVDKTGKKINVQITHVRITKEGNRKRSYIFECKPIP